ncbi:MAG: hypothetical protein JW779_14460 [Candidatus Thorarchaeota archaeon]|nr:hypothetical protein [Candidatus Thorarchaeota archaeon]
MYSTYLGGNGVEEANGIAVENGFAYIFGSTTSGDFPTVNAYDPHMSGGGIRDCFVTKFSQSGQYLEYSTALGSDLNDYAKDIVVENGYAYVTGTTQSHTTFPKVNCASLGGGGLDCFVTKLNISGSSLCYSNVIGGDDNDWGNGISVQNGVIYLAGSTESQDFPISNAYDAHLDGPWDGFLLSIDSVNHQIESCSFIGGSGYDYAYDIAVDDCYVYLTGEVGSDDFPLLYPYNSTLAGESDSFISVFAQDCCSLIYSTFFGGAASDYGYSVIIENKMIYLLGHSESSNLPQVDSYDSTYNGEVDSFTLIFSLDNDSDGLPDWTELYRLGTNPQSNDTDSDSMPDGWEVLYGLDPLNSSDAYDDLDDDSLANYLEYSFGTLASNPDSDNDTLLDGTEIYNYHTNPLSNDTDSDLMPDGWEIQYGLDPLVDDASEDADGDGLINLYEYIAGTNPLLEDTDADGYPDLWEIESGFDPLDTSLNIIEYIVYNPIVLVYFGIALFVSYLIAVSIRPLNEIRNNRNKKKEKERQEKEGKKRLALEQRRLDEDRTHKEKRMKKEPWLTHEQLESGEEAPLDQILNWIHMQYSDAKGLMQAGDFSKSHQILSVITDAMLGKWDIIREVGPDIEQNLLPQLQSDYAISHSKSEFQKASDAVEVIRRIKTEPLDIRMKRVREGAFEDLIRIAKASISSASQVADSHKHEAVKAQLVSLEKDLQLLLSQIPAEIDKDSKAFDKLDESIQKMRDLIHSNPASIDGKKHIVSALRRSTNELRVLQQTLSLSDTKKLAIDALLELANQRIGRYDSQILQDQSLRRTDEITAILDDTIRMIDDTSLSVKERLELANGTLHQVRVYMKDLDNYPSLVTAIMAKMDVLQYRVSKMDELKGLLGKLAEEGAIPEIVTSEDAKLAIEGFLIQAEYAAERLRHIERKSDEYWSLSRKHLEQLERALGLITEFHLEIYRARTIKLLGNFREK